MKTLSILNWIILGAYILVVLVSYLKGDGDDPAAKAMTQGYLILFSGFLVVLLVLNFIPVKWVKILTLVLGIVPAVYVMIHNYQSRKIMAAYEEEDRKAHDYQDPHLNLLVDAIRHKNAEEVKKLLEQDSNNIDRIGTTKNQTLLDFAVYYYCIYKQEPSFEIVKSLIEKGANPNVHHPEDPPLILKYAAILPVESFEYLLTSGVNPNALDHRSEPILYNLINRGTEKEYEQVKLLLKHGADPNIEMGTEAWKLNYAPLNYAAEKNLWGICNLLIESGADLNFEAPDGKDFWHYFEAAATDYGEDGEHSPAYRTLANHSKVLAGHQ